MIAESMSSHEVRLEVLRIADDLVERARRGDQEADRVLRGITVKAMEVDRFNDLPLPIRAYVIMVLARER